jgi:hypothetical protein
VSVFNHWEDIPIWSLYSNSHIYFLVLPNECSLPRGIRCWHFQCCKGSCLNEDVIKSNLSFGDSIKLVFKLKNLINFNLNCHVIVRNSLLRERHSLSNVLSMTSDLDIFRLILRLCLSSGCFSLRLLWTLLSLLLRGF